MLIRKIPKTGYKIEFGTELKIIGVPLTVLVHEI